MYHRTQELLVTPPAIEPVSITEAQMHLRVDGQFDSDYIQALITAARTILEQYCWSAFITQTWQYWFDRYWWKMFIPRAPVLTGWNDGSIASSSWSGGVATVLLSTADQDQFLSTLYAGQTVQISGVTPTGYNGSFPITSLTATGFTYALAGNPGSGTGGTAATPIS